MGDDSSIRVRKKRGREGIEERKKKEMKVKGRKKKKDKIENKQNCPATTDFSYSKPTTYYFSSTFGGIAIYYTPIFYFAFGSGMHEMVICFNFLFNLSLYCCCLAFLKTKLYLLKAKKKGGACFWCCFCFF